MPPDTALRSLTSHAELMALTGGDPFVRWGIPNPLTGVVLAMGGAVAVERFGRRGRGLWVLPHSGGEGAAIAGLLRLLAGPVTALGVTGISLPQEYAGELAATFPLGAGGEWDWMWTTAQPPVVPHEERLLVLDDLQDADELTALSVVHSPNGEGDPGTGRTSRWLGIRSGADGLVAAGAMQFLESGAPHLAGIVTHRDHRGLGLGRAVTAGLTRHAIAAHGVCTLGMYSANPPARAIYRSLGYRTAYAWHSRRLIEA